LATETSLTKATNPVLSVIILLLLASSIIIIRSNQEISKALLITNILPLVPMDLMSTEASREWARKAMLFFQELEI
jgi:hypothetical protein